MWSKRNKRKEVFVIPIHLLNKEFGDTFYQLIDNTTDSIVIISPFISFPTAKRFATWLEQTDGDVQCSVITRFNREEFIRGANSIEALNELLKAGASLYALQHLHTKLYVFDQTAAILGSANFTFSGFFRNHELGIFVENEPQFVGKCRNYADDLLEAIKATGDWEITEEIIEKEKTLINKLTMGRGRSRNGNEYNLHRWGAILDEEANQQQSDPGYNLDDHFDILEEAMTTEDGLDPNTGIFLKFEGNSEQRIPNSTIYLDHKRSLPGYLNRTFYPRKPRSVKDGDTVFIAMVSKDRQGIEIPIIVGYAIAKGFDESNVADQNDPHYQTWNGRYPYYVELSDGKFLKTPIIDGISLTELCYTLKHKVYPSTTNRPEVSVVNVLKRHHQKAHIQITETAKEYLIHQLESRFRKYGYDTLG